MLIEQIEYNPGVTKGVEERLEASEKAVAAHLLP